MNTPTIISSKLILRKFNITDLDSYYKIMNDKITNKFLPWFLIASKEEALLDLNKRFIDYYNLDFSIRYAICLKDDNIPIGYITLSNDHNNDFGYAIRHEYWNKGIVSEAASLVIDLIKQSKIKFITATHDVNNPASGSIMKKLGFKYQYTYTEQWMPKNKVVNFRMYQLNFDENDSYIHEEYRNKYLKNYIEAL